MIRAAVLLAFLGLNFYIYNFFATEEVRPERDSFSLFPMQLGDWVCEGSEDMGEAVERNLGVTDYLLCRYQRRKPFGIVDAYVGYHATQVRTEGGGPNENAIHPPKHCLPGSGWDIIDHRRVDLDLPGLPQRPGPVNRMVIAKGDARQLVFYWYQSRGRVIADDWKKIVLMSLDRATVNRTDGSLIRFTAPIIQKDEARAEKQIFELATLVLADLHDYVPE